jgi:hypothetical protein
MSAPDDIAPDLLARIRSGAWLDGQTFPPLAWAVPGIIPEGFGLFTGPPKVGKSWATLGIALAVASGGYAFGRVPVGEPRPVLLLALEDGDRRLQDRSRRLLAGEPIPALLDYATRADALEVLPLIEAWLNEHPGTRPLVILDTLGKVTPPAMAGESAYARDYRIGGRLKATIDAHPGAALLVVHHVRKAGAEDWLDSTSGTNGLSGSADFTVSLVRPRNESEGTLKVTGRDVAEGEYAVTVTDGSWTLRGSSLAEAAQAAQQAHALEGLGDRSAEVVAIVGRHPKGIGPTALGTMLAIPASQAGTYLARLAAGGRICKVGRGLYAPPSTPVESVESVEAEDGGNVLPFHSSTLSTPPLGGPS